MLLEVVFVTVICFVVLLFLSRLFQAKRVEIKGSHVAITGGSSGIGLAIAVNLAKRGANITLVARNQQKLNEAKKEVESHCTSSNNQCIETLSLDLTSNYDSVHKGFKQMEEKLGPVAMLINSAGLALNARFEDLAVTDFQRCLNVNYLGSVFATRAVIGGMKTNQSGRIVFISSVAGQVGVFGFTAYSASKFALKGLAEALQMEVKPYNICVTLAFPPDTDTPGYHEENKSKPKETRLISETAGLFTAETVAAKIVDDALCGRFQSYLGLDGWMVAQLTSGMGPASSLLDALQQIFLMGTLRAISLVYLLSFDNIVKKCKQERDQKDKVQ